MVKIKDIHSYDFFKLVQFFKRENKKIIFKARPHFDIKSSPVHKIDFKDDEVVLHVNLFCMGGVFGPLPTPYVEKWFEQNQKKDLGMQNFFDIFQNKIINLRYGIEKKNSIALQNFNFEESIFNKSIKALAGDVDFLKSDLKYLFIRHHDLFWKRQRSIVGFERVILNFFENMKVKVTSFQGGWRIAIKEELTILGKRYNALGKTTIIGNKTWDQESGVLVDLGVIDWEVFFNFFLKNNETKEKLKKIAINYLGLGVNINIKGSLSKLPKMILNRSQSLGVQTFLRTLMKPPKDPSFFTRLIP